ncbi:hypothetical protein A2690_00685 [Candidatus Roizmanbacteria bacterium RIFCSPHIGHO2_01_FULL_39_12b]|uniref:Uncharacterized protein n=1 Tax=Candidatus Roizmanbacteria bacterium RIFCSPHIGHO2_01_FULL_39_12b TaxID=1802030 RepID=A0A1F7GB00_9BACT|nr:MAG: hypothetical protein A2690_00685 [Candidatus Roizmanbacteria bacterium RIFCSPHIGHO2_01_FULL_39_12b]
MQKIALWCAVLVFIINFFVTPKTEAALFEPNNKVGIGLAVPDENDIKDAANLVNGNGGEWGYTTLIIQDNDRDFSKWQGVCNKLRTARLIPIFRLATHLDGGSWVRPGNRDAIEWASFLNKLNCTTKDLYIVLFNEPNHAPEWGGLVDPKDYADTALFFAKTLKNTNSNFFVMLAGLDQAAPQRPPNYYDAGQFWKDVLAVQPYIFDHIDGLVSHCYPNPGFSASPHKRGRNSIGCYEWELSILSNLGISKELPVFITETGWHSNGGNLAENYRVAYEDLWLKDFRVRAVTPFILSYAGAPFEQFSWKRSEAIMKPNSTNTPFFDQYYTVSNIAKIKGNPPQNERVNVLSPLPATLIKNSSYSFQLWLRNQGQSIWHKPDGFSIDFVKKPISDYAFSALYNVEPNDSTIINLNLETDSQAGAKDLSIGLFKDGQLKTVLFPWIVKVMEPPPISVNLSVFPGRPYEGKATIQIFDSRNKLVYEAVDVSFVKGNGYISGVKGVTIGQQYRVVALVDFYLPRQASLIVEQKNEVTFEMLIPGDANHDGKFSVEDIFLMPTNKKLYRSFLPLLFRPALGSLFSRI